MNRGKMNLFVTIAMAFLFAMSLSSCGRKGPLEAPTGTVATSDENSTSQERGNKKPDRPFILDGLI